MQVEQTPLADILPYAANARTHSDEQVEQIAASIREFGFNNPVLIDEQGTIIAGHGRVMASKRLGLSEVPTITLSHLSDAQRKAYILADNKLALNADWDESFLKLELQGLDSVGFDLSLIGFDLGELSTIFDDEEAEKIKEEQYSEKFDVIVECETEMRQQTVFEDLKEMGLKCRVQSL